MLNLIKMSLLAIIAVAAFAGFAQAKTSVITDEQRLITPGKLDAAEFDMLIDQIREHIVCLNKMEDIIGASEDDSHGMISAIGQMVFVSQQELNDAMKKNDLDQLRATGTQLNNFIKGTLNPNYSTSGVPECSII